MSDRAPVDLSMLEMFRVEVHDRTETLNAGIVALEGNPTSKEELQNLMRAAHSIKGASRIVGLEIGVQLAHEMEDCFVAAQEGRLKLEPWHMDFLLQGVDVFSRLAESPDTELEAWLDAQIPEIEALAKQIGGLAKGPAAASAGSAQSSPPTPAPQPPPPATAEVSAQELSSIDLDMSMFDMFRVEVEAHAATLNDGLIALESNPTNTESLQSLMRAAHSIKGASRIVGLEAGVKLAHELEDCFVAAQEGRTRLTPEHIDLLLQGVDLFVQLAQTSEPEILTWLKVHKSMISGLAGQIAACGQNPVPTPAAPPAQSAAPTVTAPPPRPPSPVSVPPPPQTHTQPDALGMPSMVGGSLALAPRPVTGASVLPAATTTRNTTGARVVRVNADNLNRLLGLAGESLVETHWRSRFSDSLLQVRRAQNKLSAAIRRLRNAMEAGAVREQLEPMIGDLEQRSEECSRSAAERLAEFELFSHRTSTLAMRLHQEAVTSRMRPFDDGIQGFPRLVRDLARQMGKSIRFDVLGRATEVDRDILEKLEAPLNHLIRNAVDHGLESPDERQSAGKNPTGVLTLEARHRAGMLFVSVSDDGRGVNLDRLREKILERKLAAPEMVAKMTEPELLEFLFLPGFSTAKQVTEISGRGVGLDVVQTMIQESSGTVRIISKFGQGTMFQLQLPITLSVIHALLAEVGSETFAFPISRIERLVSVPADSVQTLENRQFVTIEGENVGVVAAAQVLELPHSSAVAKTLSLIVVSDRSNRYALAVERFAGEREVVVKPLDPRLGKVPAIAAAAILEDGAPVLVVDVEDLVRCTDNLLSGNTLRKVGAPGATIVAQKVRRVLVVDDSFTVRETERKLLERHGYDVKTAVDGVDGWNAARTSNFDLIISDVDMPRMNGLELVRLIKNDERLKNIPVMMVSYKDREEDRLRGLEAGANYYLAKSSFNDDTLIRAVVDLIGEARCASPS